MWKRGGYSFLEIQLPLDLKGSCPEGFKTCNPESSPEKRLCSLEYNLCPINEIKITDSGPEEPAFTRQGKELSLARFELSESQPSKNSLNYPTAATPRPNPYVLEQPFSEGCSIDFHSSKFTDYRFNQVKGF